MAATWSAWMIRSASRLCTVCRACSAVSWPGYAIATSVANTHPLFVGELVGCVDRTYCRHPSEGASVSAAPSSRARDGQRGRASPPPLGLPRSLTAYPVIAPGTPAWRPDSSGSVLAGVEHRDARPAELGTLHHPLGLEHSLDLAGGLGTAE